MIAYFSQDYDYKELCSRAANFGIFAGARKIAYTDGKAKGVEAVEVSTGSGLRFTVLPDRGLDIAFAEFKGIPLAYISQAGIVAPQYYEAEGDEWLRSFTGGLLTTCGLRQVGTPCQFEGEKHGLHGRIGNCPASQVCVWEQSAGNEYCIRITGKIHQAKSCAENLIITREIEAMAGSSRICVRDTIENRGNTKQPFMLLYHCNVGFPLINDNAQIFIPHRSISSMYEGREEQMKKYGYIGPPSEEIGEDVFYFDAVPDQDGYAGALVVNDRDCPQLALQIRYHMGELDNLAVWKQCCVGDYVVGIEPCNNGIKGLAEAQQSGRLKYLSPGEVKTTELCFEVFDGNDALNITDKYFNMEKGDEE